MSPRLTALALAAVLGGCSSGQEEAQPRSARGAPKEVAEVIARFEEATAARDFAAVCDLYTTDARAELGGGDCAQLLSSRSADLRRPRLRVIAIEVGARSSFVRVEARAQGQAPVRQTIEVVREDGGYLIEGLGP